MFRLNRNERSHWSGNGVHVESELVFMIGRNMHLPGLLAIRIGFTSDPLAFEDLEETLRHRVIMTIATFAHAGLEPVIPQKSCQS